MSVDKDLATLREARRSMAASLIAVKGHLDEPYPDDPRWTPWTRFIERELQRLDETKTVLDRLKAELSRLREERDDAVRVYDAALRREEAAEARCARLQQALRRLRTLVNLNFYGASRVEAIAIIVDALVDEFRDDEALAGPDTPADSQEDKT